jgi:hypothetical protein
LVLPWVELLEVLPLVVLLLEQRLVLPPYQLLQPQGQLVLPVQVPLEQPQVLVLEPLEPD